MINALGYVIFVLVIFLIIYLLFIREYVIAKRKFKCLRCGECCRLKVYPSKAEIKKIKAKGYSDFIDEKGAIKFDEYGNCVFLGERKGLTCCKIQDAKPSTCINFPFINTRFGKKIDNRCKTCVRRLW